MNGHCRRAELDKAVIEAHQGRWSFDLFELGRGCKGCGQTCNGKNHQNKERVIFIVIRMAGQ